MSLFNFVCQECNHTFEVFSPSFLRKKQKKCQSCGSTDVRQTLRSYLRNGSAASTECGAPTGSGFG